MDSKKRIRVESCLFCLHSKCLLFCFPIDAFENKSFFLDHSGYTLKTTLNQHTDHTLKG